MVGNSLICWNFGRDSPVERKLWADLWGDFASAISFERILASECARALKRTSEFSLPYARARAQTNEFSLPYARARACFSLSKKDCLCARSNEGIFARALFANACLPQIKFHTQFAHNFRFSKLKVENIDLVIFFTMFVIFEFQKQNRQKVRYCLLWLI